jgi:hypothetical protein
MIEWFVDGVPTTKGLGSKTFSVPAPDQGKSLAIGIRFTSPDGAVFTRERVFRSATVDLLWEPLHSYVPPFYKGKTLPSSESQIRFVAIPASTGVSSVGRGSGFIFNWKNSDQNDADASGINKDSYSITNSYLDDSESIGVSVSGTQTSFSASTQESVNMITPLIYFYEQDPLLGTDYSHALLDRFTMTSKETTLVAAPYFLSPKNFTSDAVSFTWIVNGDTIATPSTKNQLVIRNQSGKEGDVLIGLNIKSIYKLFGEVAKSLTVTLTK